MYQLGIAVPPGMVHIENKNETKHFKKEPTFGFTDFSLLPTFSTSFIFV
jgi:hypothetical protein